MILGKFGMSCRTRLRCPTARAAAADLIVAQGGESILESHRREIVFVFCELRGFTAPAAQSNNRLYQNLSPALP
jgi:hypothetical protein